MSIPSLFFVQQGKEATDAWGTAVAQTVKLMGITDFTMSPMEESEQLVDIRASMQPAHQSVIDRRFGNAAMGGWLTYQDAPYLFDAAMGTATGVIDTDIYTYAYSAPGETEPEVRYNTLTYGNADSDVTSLLGATLVDFSLSGQKNAPLTYQSNWIGKLVGTDTIDSVADRTVNPAMGAHASIWIDPASDTPGTTAVATTFFSFDLNYNTNRVLKYHMGSLTPSDFTEAKHTGDMSLSLEANAVSQPYLDEIFAVTTAPVKKVVRIRYTWPDVTDWVIDFDFTGSILTAPTLYDDVDGVVAYSFTLQGEYGSGDASFFSASVVNALSAMP